MKILAVEDDPDILQLLMYTLQSAGYEAVSGRDGYEALNTARVHHPDLVVLDLMIPGIDGFEVCKELKRDSATRNIPVVMLTAKGEEIDRVVGLELGADDYVVKPFSPRELLLRIKAILRRSGTDPATESSLWQKEGFRVDLAAHKVTINGEEVPLTATEFKLLAELIRRRGRVQTRDELLDRVWGYQFDGYARTVDTHVRRLRQKVAPYSDWVETVRGVGYRFKG